MRKQKPLVFAKAKCKPLTDDQKEVVYNILHDVAVEALGGPGGDPDLTNYRVAAIAYRAMRLLGIDTSREDAVEDGEGDGEDGVFTHLDGLRGTTNAQKGLDHELDESANVWKHDFLAEQLMDSSGRRVWNQKMR